MVNWWGNCLADLPVDGAPITFKTLSEDNWDNGRKVYNLLLAAEVLTAYEITTKKTQQVQLFLRCRIMGFESIVLPTRKYSYMQQHE